MNEPDRSSRIREWVRSCKIELQALLLASRHPGTPWYAKVWLAGIVAYAFSPIDLIPDFIPVLGYLDDLLLLPIGIWIGMRMVPGVVMEECRREARNATQQEKPRSMWGALFIVLLWGVCFALTVYVCMRIYQS
jgi:uncharacterized membrane protein YkvA (DUF1232 family)